MITYVSFELALHGLGISNQMQFDQFYAALKGACAEVQADYVAVKRGPLDTDVELELIEHAGHFEKSVG
jgi:hypothetical protein